jgi:hypothetical protein
MQNWYAFERREWLPNLGTIPEFHWREWQNQQHTSFGKVDVTDEIRTKRLLNKNPQPYCYSIPRGLFSESCSNREYTLWTELGYFRKYENIWYI